MFLHDGVLGGNAGGVLGSGEGEVVVRVVGVVGRGCMQAASADDRRRRRRERVRESTLRRIVGGAAQLVQ